MPLKGILCEVTGEEFSFEHCLSCSRVSHPCDFTPEILQGIFSSSTTGREDAGVSVTMLTGCLRKSFYSVTRDYHQYPHKLWPAFRGTMVHALLEEHPMPGYVYETRFARQTSSGLWVTGKMDKLAPEEQLIVDYKTKSELPDQVSDGYILQLNIYRWILQDAVVVTPGPQCPWGRGERVSVEVNRLGLVYLTMDEVAKYPIALLDLGEVGAEVERSAALLQQALDGGRIPPRQFRNPERSNFCRNWCPFLKECVAAGEDENDEAVPDEYHQT